MNAATYHADLLVNHLLEKSTSWSPEHQISLCESLSTIDFASAETRLNVHLRLLMLTDPEAYNNLLVETGPVPY
jgi:hypothetical protein